MGGYFIDKKSFDDTVTEVIKLTVKQYGYCYEFMIFE